MKDEEGKRITMVHDRFQVCCADGCGFVSGHQTKAEAITAAGRHDCGNVEVWDSMAHKKSKDIVWYRANSALAILK